MEKSDHVRVILGHSYREQGLGPVMTGSWDQSCHPSSGHVAGVRGVPRAYCREKVAKMFIHNTKINTHGTPGGERGLLGSGLFSTNCVNESYV